MNSSILTPEQYFGFPIGTDRKLARWDKIAAYFEHLNEHSDRIQVANLGKTTEGESFLLALISSPENLAQQEHYRSIARSLARSKDLEKSAALGMATQAKAVVAISCSIHSSEQVGVQMAPELAYQLVTSESSRIQEILGEVILLLFPCVNPDGQVMVTDWYHRWIGTEYEGTPLPWLYHKYTGHDNNRDSYMLTQRESQMFGKVLYREWYPQIHIDIHQMGRYGARFYVPPWCDPIHPNIDPLIWREGQWLGAHIAAELEAEGIVGVENATSFAGWNMGGWCKYAGYMHQIAGTFETASIQLATPMYIHPDQLRPSSTPRGRASGVEPQMIFPHPWPGGWWRMADMVRQNLIGAISVLEFAAKHKAKILMGMHTKAQRSVQLGKSEPPFAYILPQDQHDPSVLLKLIRVLLQSEVEVHRATSEFRVGAAIFPAGSYVVFLAQPLRPIVKSFFERTLYPDNEFTRDSDGRPVKGQLDLATWTLVEFMGLEAIPIENVFTAEFEILDSAPSPRIVPLKDTVTGYILSGQFNDTFAVVNQLLREGIRVFRVESDSRAELGLSIGDFFIPNEGQVATLLEKAQQTHEFSVTKTVQDISQTATEIRHARVGIYQGYNGGNMDEGWCRWVLEEYAFPFFTVLDSDFHVGDLRGRFDLILFAEDSDAAITGQGTQGPVTEMQQGQPPVPPEYRSGLGDEGIANLRHFVEMGGTLLTIGKASDFACKRMQLPIINAAENLRTDEFWCPGSTLHVQHDSSSRLAYGMPSKGLILGVNPPVFDIRAHPRSDKIRVVSRYQNTDTLQSGRLEGESLVKNKPALLELEHGQGRVILFGFRPHFRAQTHGTYKLLFNALYRYL